MSTKIIIVGGGLAGMVAAYAAQQEGAEVVLIDRGPIGIGTNSSLSNGTFAGPTSRYDSAAYCRDTMETGRYLNRHSAVKLVAREAPGALHFLRSLGLSIKENPVNYVVVSPTPDVIPGVTLVRRLSETLKQRAKIHIIRGVYVTDIMVNDNHVCGVKALGRTGEEIAIESPVVVLATGGAGALYLRHDNQKNILGQGYYLAAKAGLELRDMEFVQFFPLVMAESRLPKLIVYPPYAKEVKLIDAAGNDVMDIFNLGSINTAILKKRDEFSARLYEKTRHSPVYMDFRGVPDALWEAYPLSLLKKLKFDFRAKPVAVSPAAHFFMGGISIDETGETEIRGLFACGEIIWGLHGANRMGGNALTECVVTGSIAGRHAARRCLGFPGASFRYEKSLRVTPSREARFPNGLKELLRAVKETAWNCAGVVRSEKIMREGFVRLEEIKEEVKGVPAGNPADIILREDMMSAIVTLEAVLTASIGRLESRGSFIRSDFPREDDADWRTNSCLKFHEGENRFSVRHSPASFSP